MIRRVSLRAGGRRLAQRPDTYGRVPTLGRPALPSVRVWRRPDVFGSADWARIAAGIDHPFASPEWAAAWWRWFGDGTELRVVEARAGERLLGFVPLSLDRGAGGERVLRFLGGDELTDYEGPVAADGLLPELARAFAGWLAGGEARWDVLDASYLQPPVADALVAAVRARGMTVTRGSAGEAPVVDLPGDWESYLERLPKKSRHELRRKRRRFAARCGPISLRRATPGSLHDDVSLFVAMHRASHGEKGTFMQPPVVGFLREVTAWLMERRSLQLDFLEVDGEPYAATLSFRTGSAVQLYNSAFRADRGDLSPGIVLVSELVRRGIEDGARKFDFLRGAERYKYGFGATDAMLDRVVVTRARATAPGA
jgi:CelD/BcsL family acetyltransferase involved in cellulose biosynthesis